MVLVHQLTVSSLCFRRLWAVSPNILMCISGGSKFRITSNLICGVVLVRLVVSKQANLISNDPEFS